MFGVPRTRTPDVARPHARWPNPLDCFQSTKLKVGEGGEMEFGKRASRIGNETASIALRRVVVSDP